MQKNELLSCVKEGMQWLALDEGAEKCILEGCRRLTEKEAACSALCALLAPYGTRDDFDFSALCDGVKEMADAVGVHPMTAYLIAYISMLPRLRQTYAEKNIPDKVFLATAPDLRYKMTERHLLDGVYGISEGSAKGWYPSLFRARTLTFCRLQFLLQEARFECECEGVRIEKNTPVLHIHIPRTGGKIDRESILSSYREAAEYYAPFFDGRPIVMTTRTWMFFPRHAEFLPESSNMMQFYHDFHLVEWGEYEDYSELWRIFDCHYKGDASALPVNTALRRAYADLVRRGEKTGWGRGVLIYKRSIKAQ